MTGASPSARQLAVAIGLVAIGCISCSRSDDRPIDTLRASPAPPTDFPRTGIAVRDTAGSWCAAFPPDSIARQIAPGDTLAIVFGAAEGPVASYARIGAPRSSQCHAAFAQPGWDGYHAYDVTFGEVPAPSVNVSNVALAVVSPARWTRERSGVIVADLAGDGIVDQVRRCAADEGEHFTIWSVIPDRAAQRRAHEYYDWGAFVEVTCKAGEDGRE